VCYKINYGYCNSGNTYFSNTCPKHASANNMYFQNYNIKFIIKLYKLGFLNNERVLEYAEKYNEKRLIEILTK
jgi:hypothetical protein